jgi:salicylate 5-hydroxylase small subunit
MSAIEPLRQIEALHLRLQLEELYADYAACLDAGELERWPEFFTDACTYKIIPRENHDRGLPLATWLCESKGMLQDRVTAIRQTSMYAPRYMRHMVSAILIKSRSADTLIVQANYLVVETLIGELTRVFQSGRYLDTLVLEDGQFRFREKLCVFDSVLVPNSLVFPI